MKNWRYILRLAGILIVGILLLKMTYHFYNSVFIVDLMLFAALSIIGLGFFIWSLFSDIRQFRRNKEWKSLIPIIVGVAFTIVIWIWNEQIHVNFDKPTLVRVHYDGDFNGVGIDFKMDGSYIFDNYAMGMSDYTYGTYQIDGNVITLDRSYLQNAIRSHRLQIQTKTIEYSDGTVKEEYLVQLDKNGKVIENATSFRLIVDNRPK